MDTSKVEVLSATDADLDLLRTSVRRFVEGEVAPLLQQAEAAGEMPQSLLDLIARHGYAGARIAPRWGGQGLSLPEFCVVLEEFARIGPGITFWIQDSVGVAVERFGTESQKEKYLPDYTLFKKQGAIGMTEPGAGSDAAAIRVRAVKCEGGWRISGTKHYISRGDVAHFIMLMAVTDPTLGTRGGMTTFLVDQGTPGFTVPRAETSMGSQLHKLAELHFDDCFVPDAAVLGEVGQGFANSMATLDTGRLISASTALGVASRLVDLMVEHAGQRTTFGARLADRQGIRWMIADSVTELQLGRALLEQSINRAARGVPLGVNAAMCKLHCTEAASRIADRAVQIYGGMGVVRGVTVEQLYREVRFLRIGEGTSEVQRMIIARSVLGRPAREGD